MCHSWQGKRQGHLVPIMDDTYNSTIDFKIIRKEKSTNENNIRGKKKNKENRKQRNSNTVTIRHRTITNESQKKKMLHRVNISMLTI